MIGLYIPRQVVFGGLTESAFDHMLLAYFGIADSGSYFSACFSVRQIQFFYATAVPNKASNNGCHKQAKVSNMDYTSLSVHRKISETMTDKNTTRGGNERVTVLVSE